LYEPCKFSSTLYDDIDKNEFDKIYKAFMNVYPQISDDLEKGWESFCQLLLTQKKNIKQKDCNHEWKERHLYKFGKYYECPKCYLTTAKYSEIIK
jgi:hypothetical protein